MTPSRAEPADALPAFIDRLQRALADGRLQPLRPQAARLTPVAHGLVLTPLASPLFFC